MRAHPALVRTRVTVLGVAVDVVASSPLGGVLQAALADLAMGPSGRAAGAPRSGRSATRRARPDAVVEARSGRNGWRVRSRGDGDGGERPLTGLADDVALHEVLARLNRLGARRVARTAAPLHASTVVVSGHAVAFAGASGAGKSTAALGAVRSGHGYLADEVSAVDATGTVLAYHRPIGVRRDSAMALGVEPGPYRVGERHTLASASPLALVVLVQREVDRPPAPTCTLVPVDPARALHRLCGLTIGADEHGSAVFRRLDGLVRRVPVVEAHDVTGDALVAAVSAWVDGASR